MKMRTRTESPYFHPRPFVGNNIEYRMGSSAALARFKESQAFILNQLAFNPFHKFSRTAKEILLLKFDVWFDLLSELEQYFLIKQDDILFSEVWALVQLRRDYACNTLIDTEIIDQEYLKHYLKVMDMVKEYHHTTVSEILSTNITPVSKFGAIIDMSIRSLNHVLYIIQEMDIMMSNETPIFNLDTMSCETIIGEKLSCYATDRINLYQNIRPFDEIIIKNYLDLDIPFHQTPFHDMLQASGIKYTLI